MFRISGYKQLSWSLLSDSINRKVVVLQPFSSKFFGFRHPLMVANNYYDIKEVKDIPTYPRALAESRDANLKFSKKYIT